MWQMVTNKRRPILTVVADTCGVHDTLMSACDLYRYQGLGVQEYHDSCTDNLHAGRPPELHKQVIDA